RTRLSLGPSTTVGPDATMPYRAHDGGRNEQHTDRDDHAHDGGRAQHLLRRGACGMTHLVSVGAGAAATLTALHLARAIAADPHRRARVTFVDPQPQATGAAFGTTDPDHLLNVPASGMSVDPEHRFDFVEWCHDEGLLAEDASPYWFAPRMQW